MTEMMFCFDEDGLDWKELPTSASVSWGREYGNFKQRWQDGELVIPEGDIPKAMIQRGGLIRIWFVGTGKEASVVGTDPGVRKPDKGGFYRLRVRRSRSAILDAGSAGRPQSERVGEPVSRKGPT